MQSCGEAGGVPYNLATHQGTSHDVKGSCRAERGAVCGTPLVSTRDMLGPLESRVREPGDGRPGEGNQQQGGKHDEEATPGAGPGRTQDPSLGGTLPWGGSAGLPRQQQGEGPGHTLPRGGEGDAAAAAEAAVGAVAGAGEERRGQGPKKRAGSQKQGRQAGGNQQVDGRLQPALRKGRCDSRP